jgi:hypothetical protein
LIDISRSYRRNPFVEGGARFASATTVDILLGKTLDELMPCRFLAAMGDRVLGATPVTMHREARNRRSDAAAI